MDKVHRFDAGDMGCLEGLPTAFRQRLEEIPPGEILEVIARDPSARDDLPALAELLGHEVLSSSFDSSAAVVVRIRRKEDA